MVIRVDDVNRCKCDLNKGVVAENLCDVCYWRAKYSRYEYLDIDDLLVKVADLEKRNRGMISRW